MSADREHEPDPLESLTGKERAFVLAYTGEAKWNGVQAAQIAGFGSTYDSSKNAAYVLLTKPHIRQAVRTLTAHQAMQAEELLTRLGEEARVDMGDFADCWMEVEGRTVLDWKRVNKKGLGVFIKAVRRTRQGDSIELIDTQRSKELIGRALGLFTEKLHIRREDYDKLTDEQLEALIAGKKPPGL